MKTLLATLLIAPGLFAAEPDFDHLKVAPLPFPTGTAESAELSFEAVDELANGFDAVIGSYPPRWKSPDDRPATYEEWSRAVLALDRIRMSEGDTERMVVLQARLHRQGHNMDVQGCSQRAATAIEAGLEKFPDSIAVNFQASYFYLQINPKFAPKGEKALKRLRRLLGTDENLEVERGLVFAYLYQDKIQQAKKQVDRCLKLAPKDDMLRKLRDALKAGRVQRNSN